MLFNLILGIVLAGQFNPIASPVEFVIVVGGGLAVGLTLGYVFSLLLRQVNEYLIETVLTLVLAYGTYFLAEQLHVSGIIAIVAAGVLVGNYGRRVAFSPTSKIAVGLSWELFGFLANSLIFLFVGLQIKPTDFAGAGEIVALAIGAVLVARGLVVLGVGVLLRALHRDPPIPWRWQTVLFWGGLRGAVSLALALSIPLTINPVGDAFPHRATLILMTFGVIFFSLLAQGLTMKPLLRRLGLGRPTADLAEYEDTQAQLRAVNAALQHLEQHARHGQVPPEVIATLRAEYEQRAHAIVTRLRDLNLQNTSLRDRVEVAERRVLLQTEKSTLRDLLSAGEISEDALRELTAAIDRQLHDLASGGLPGAEPDAESARPAL